MQCLLLLSLTILIGCGGSATKSDSDMMSWVPENASAVFSMNISKIAQIKMFEEAFDPEKMKKDEDSEKFIAIYKKVLETTGLDPKKDLKNITVAAFGDLEKKDEVNFAAIVNIIIDKEKVLGLIKKENKEMNEETYLNEPLFKGEVDFDGKKRMLALSFVKDNAFVVGTEAETKQILELSQGKGNAITKNDAMKKNLPQGKDRPIFFAMVQLPEEVRTMPQSSQLPVKLDFSKAETLVAFVDFKNDEWNGEIKIISPNPEGNQETASSLNTMKGFGALAGPEVSEVLNKITISSSDDNIKIGFSITTDMIEKLKKKFASEMESKMGDMAAEEEKTEE